MRVLQHNMSLSINSSYSTVYNGTISDTHCIMLCNGDVKRINSTCTASFIVSKLLFCLNNCATISSRSVHGLMNYEDEPKRAPQSNRFNIQHTLLKVTTVQYTILYITHVSSCLDTQIHCNCTHLALLSNWGLLWES